MIAPTRRLGGGNRDHSGDEQEIAALVVLVRQLDHANRSEGSAGEQRHLNDGRRSAPDSVEKKEYSGRQRDAPSTDAMRMPRDMRRCRSSRSTAN
jgi:hypothetical protein